MKMAGPILDIIIDLENLKNLRVAFRGKVVNVTDEEFNDILTELDERISKKENLLRHLFECSRKEPTQSHIQIATELYKNQNLKTARDFCESSDSKHIETMLESIGVTNAKMPLSPLIDHTIITFQSLDDASSMDQADQFGIWLKKQNRFGQRCFRMKGSSQVYYPAFELTESTMDFVVSTLLKAVK